MNEANYAGVVNMSIQCTSVSSKSKKIVFLLLGIGGKRIGEICLYKLSIDSFIE